MAEASSVHPPSSDARIAELEATVAELRDLVAQQGAVLQGLTEPSGVVTSIGDSTGDSTPTAPVAPTDPRVSRRGLLLGTAAAAAAGGAAVLATSSPAAANGQGQSLTLGDLNTATAITGVTTTLNNSVAMTVNNLSTIGSGLSVQAGNASGFSGTGAIIGHSQGRDGVLGMSANAYGVHGRSALWTGAAPSPPQAGVLGEAGEAPGVRGLSNEGNGVEGRGATGVVGFATTNGTGVIGSASSGTGVAGGATSGTGLSGSSSTGRALLAVSNTGLAADLRSNYAQIRFDPGVTFRKAPSTDTVGHAAGEVVFDDIGDLWFSVQDGTPGKWRKLAGPGTAGAFHLLPAPVRIYDSRPGTQPVLGPKTPLAANTSRTIQVKNGGAPQGATAAMVTVLLVNTVAGNGNFTIWANGVAKPASNSMVWGGSTGRNSIMTLTALNGAAEAQVNSSLQTDIVLDVLGYYL